MAKFNILMSEDEEQEFLEKLEDEKKMNLVPYNSFFIGIRGWRPNQHIESADNRRAAGIFTLDL